MVLLSVWELKQEPEQVLEQALLVQVSAVVAQEFAAQVGAQAFELAVLEVQAEVSLPAEVLLQVYLEQAKQASWQVLLEQMSAEAKLAVWGHAFRLLANFYPLCF